MPAPADLDHPHVHLTLDFIVLLLGRALLLLADPTSKAAEPCDEGRIGVGKGHIIEVRPEALH